MIAYSYRNAGKLAFQIPRKIEGGLGFSTSWQVSSLPFHRLTFITFLRRFFSTVPTWTGTYLYIVTGAAYFSLTNKSNSDAVSL